MRGGLTAPPRHIRFKAREVLELGTLGGARVAGLEAVTGSLSPGKQADLVLIRTDAINMVRAIDAAAVVLNANVHDVDTVMVADRIVKRAGQLTGVGWPRLATELRASSARLVAGFEAAPIAEIERFAAGLMLGTA